MAVNIEIKARVIDSGMLRRRIESISKTPAELIIQEDIFFNTEKGRLKLRILAPDLGQLIYYEREDRSGPKRSNYSISETAEPEKLKVVLEQALGIRGVVKKRRWLYWVGNTRIHLDEVEGLGSFVELEVVLGPGHTTRHGEVTATDLMNQLMISQGDLIDGAYIDLLENSLANE